MKWLRQLALKDLLFTKLELTSLFPLLNDVKANSVLKSASAPGVRGIPGILFQSCQGIILISAVSTTFLLNGSAGTGIVLAKLNAKEGLKSEDIRWSLPCACACTGTGWGIGMGITVQDILIFIMDKDTLHGLGNSRMGLSLGAHVGITVGVGRNASFTLGRKGGTVSIAFTKGAYAGASLDGGLIGVRPGVNEKFYGKPVKSLDILMGNEELQLPKEREMIMDEIYETLSILSIKAYRDSGLFEPVPEMKASLRDVLGEEVLKHYDSDIKGEEGKSEKDQSVFEPEK